MSNLAFRSKQYLRALLVLRGLHRGGVDGVEHQEYAEEALDFGTMKNQLAAMYQTLLPNLEYNP